MVKGLELFREHFTNYAGQYVLIGGTACTMLLENVGLSFRATKDIDVVLCAEALTDDFVRAFWAFVHTGGYRVRQKSDGTSLLYRFSKPANPEYPNMLELFSRKPSFSIEEGSHLAPIPSDDEAYSLSAILLDDDYYQFIRDGAMTINGIAVVDASHLIPIKISAYLDMRHRKVNGEQIDSKTISKHKNDVLRLMAIAPAEPRIALPRHMMDDVDRFIAVMKEERPNPRDLGINTLSLDKMLENIEAMYRQLE
jgi:hypothetical protein